VKQLSASLISKGGNNKQVIKKVQKIFFVSSSRFPEEDPYCTENKDLL
jgi:hypothetical protein